jgi:hypothetical protein
VQRARGQMEALRSTKIIAALVIPDSADPCAVILRLMRHAPRPCSSNLGLARSTRACGPPREDQRVSSLDSSFVLVESLNNAGLFDGSRLRVA